MVTLIALAVLTGPAQAYEAVLVLNVENRLGPRAWIEPTVLTGDGLLAG